MAECLPSLQKLILPVLEYSGRGVSQKGNYPECLANPDMNYNFVMAGYINTTDPVAAVGLCLPKKCDSETVKLALDTALKPANLHVVNINTDVEGFHWPFDWVFFLTIILLVTFIFLITYATLQKPKNMLGAFSIQESLKIFQSNPKSNLNVLNGVRSLAMMWVVIGHSFSYSIQASVNVATFDHIVLQPEYLIILAGLFAVDVFFFVGGLLVAYVVLKDSSKNQVKYLVAILQRLLRFWPSYLFAIMIYYSMYLHLGEGPIWGLDQRFVQQCQRIWKPMLFVDNLVENGNNQCMGWGWYLQNDMQLFILSMGLLLTYNFKRILCICLIWLMNVGSFIFTFVWTYKQQMYVQTHIQDFQREGTFLQDVYFKPWARCSPYLFGLLLGILYHEYLVEKKQEENQSQDRKTYLAIIEQKVHQKKNVRLAIEWTGILIMFFLVAIPRTLQVDIKWAQFEHSLYLAMAKFFFVFGLSLTILPSLLGCRDSFIMFLMDTKFFNFIAKISFCTYLLHLTWLSIWNNGRKADHYYSLKIQFVEYCGSLVISLLLGAIMTFMIEAPFAKLQKTFIGWIKNRSVKKIQPAKQQQLLMRNQSV